MGRWREAKAKPKRSASVSAPEGGQEMTTAEKKLARKRLSGGTWGQEHGVTSCNLAPHLSSRGADNPAGGGVVHA